MTNETDGPGPWPQFNNISFEFPPFSMLTQRDMMNASVICDGVPNSHHCIGTFCSCTVTKKVPLNALVEIVMVDVGVVQRQYHPIHLHGHKFYVVAMASLSGDVSLEYVRNLNEGNQIRKKLSKAPAKDTVSVPNNGYTIIRFKADNPGFWLFHCHITHHLVLGMAMVLQVGELSEMAETPPNFPSCRSSLYDPIAQELQNPLRSSVRQTDLLSCILASLLIGVISVNLS
ncbi:hypothetical protein J6590_069536 [Homalodisca vitripennis]|nr:hypothetical protein J6590_069536 [Homalodisca vitripennis]